MPSEERKTVKWTDSDRALAYLIVSEYCQKLGEKFSASDSRNIAASRSVSRTADSWGLKIQNYSHASDLLAGREVKKPHVGGCIKPDSSSPSGWRGEYVDVAASAQEDPEAFLALALSEWSNRTFGVEIYKSINPNATTPSISDFSLVTKEHVMSAIEDYGSGKRLDGFSKSLSYDLLYESGRYPPKMIMGMAYRMATGEVITGAMFEGGLNTPCFKRFEELGFKLVPKEPDSSQNFMNYEQRLICALAAKPFVILAGGTGTGKTKSAIETVKKLCKPTTEAKMSEQFAVIAVGADWTDTRPLLGYVNLLIENGPAYSAPAALKLILRAHKNKDQPHFLILDEMNLSHVERYFSDFLSLMEAKKIDKTAATIKLHSEVGDMKSAEAGSEPIPAEIPWPTNLFVIGTVNIDETTHMFSPKVLDRAHVIEYKVEWSSQKSETPRHDILAGLDKMIGKESAEGDNTNYSETLGPILVTTPEERLKGIGQTPMESCKQLIGKVWGRLNGTRFAFSHRTAQEAVGYVLIASAMSERDDTSKIIGKPDTMTLIDYAVLQKILPKINGSIETLSAISTSDGKKDTSLLDQLREDCNGLPCCEEKLRKMSETLKREHFVSFIQ